MPKKRLSMRKLTEVLRLNAAGLSARQIARSCGVARSTVAEHLERMQAAGLTWPLAPELKDEDLERRLFGGNSPTRNRDPFRSLADWPMIHKELTKKGVTLKLLWQEYRQESADGYQYSQFCEHYRRWAKSLDVCLRQTYRAGERLFVDYAGLTVPLHDPHSGEIHEAQVFVAALGASHYLYAEATRSQQLPDWIEAHIHAYEYLQGVTEITVPDNLKSGVARACRYDPDINPTYQDMAAHYGTAIIPTRPRHPRDNAKAESGVQVVEREVLAPLRHQTFFSLAELNQAIWARIQEVNRRKFQKLDVSRHDLYIEFDKPALKPLPPTRYEYAEFLKARVNIDYHIEVLGHYYSVPYELKGQQLDVRLSARMVEALHKGRRVAAHLRDDRKGRHTTEASHMPRAHREHLAWTPSRIIHWAGTIGPHCAQAVQQIIDSRPHPEQGYPRVKQLWRDCEDAARRAMAGTPTEVSGMLFRVADGTLLIRLRSGRELVYPRVREQPATYETFQYIDRHGARNTAIDDRPGILYGDGFEIYGGLIVENIVQGTSRDLLVDAMFRLESAGLAIVHHCHDSVTVAVPDAKAEAAGQELVAAWRQVPRWVAGLALDAEVEAGPNLGRMERVAACGLLKGVVGTLEAA